jgi:hypothetical protein
MFGNYRNINEIDLYQYKKESIFCSRRCRDWRKRKYTQTYGRREWCNLRSYI